MIFCLVRTEPQAEKHAGVSYLIFSMKTPGVEVRPLTTMTGHAEFNEVFFTDVRVPKSQVVGKRGEGWRVANTTLKHERGMLGDPNAAEGRLAAIIELMGEESVDGRRLIEDPTMLDRLMRLQGKVLAMKCNGLRLLSAQLAGETAGLASLIVKLQGCEINHQLAALAIDALGETRRALWRQPAPSRHRLLAAALHVRPGADHRRRHGPDPKEHHRRAGPWLAARTQAGEGLALEFALTLDQRMMQESLEGSLQRLAPLGRVRSFAENDEPFAADIWRGLAELGVPGLLIGETHGGLGLGLLEAALAAEKIGACVAPAPLLGAAILGPLAIAAGSAAQQSRWLPQLAAGEALAGVAISEAVSGARDGAGVQAKDGRLTGKSLFVIDSAQADVFIVADNAGMLHLAPRDAPGLTLIALATIDRTRRLGELRLEAAPAEPLARADAVLPRLRAAAWIILAADMLGASQAMLDKAVAYAGERAQFGRLIGSFQAVKHMLAEMAAELEPCRALVWYAAHAFDALPREAPLAAAHAKAHLSEVSRFVARTATEVHGGVGFTDALGLHYWFKRVGLDRQLLGGPEHVRRQAARLQGLAA